MKKLPKHRSADYSDFGLRVRRIGANGTGHVPVAYDHQDDYYIFGMLESGKATGIIDFKETRFDAGDFFVIQPGQVHRFIDSENPSAWVLIADSSFVDTQEKYIFDKLALMRRYCVLTKA